MIAGGEDTKIWNIGNVETTLDRLCRQKTAVGRKTIVDTGPPPLPTDSNHTSTYQACNKENELFKIEKVTTYRYYRSFSASVPSIDKESMTFFLKLKVGEQRIPCQLEISRRDLSLFHGNWNFLDLPGFSDSFQCDNAALAREIDPPLILEGIKQLLGF